ncbi:SMI1/KNR4 family protein [Streptomyces tremellae]|uniref:Knr4/Smi1-like domain-containing protein n=1 Tax=Streptomyces tremellae TaxID=1124239 RepID=A0ABP7EAZ2_9ACTN
MTAVPEALAFRTERRLPGGHEWVADRGVLVVFAPGDPVELAQLCWRDRDGAEATVDFDRDTGGFLGVRLAADGTSYAWRGHREEDPPERVPHRLRTLRPEGEGELRLLVEDGGAPVVRVSWTDTSGGGGCVTLRGEPLASGELTGRVRAVAASGEHTAAGEVAENVLDDTAAKWLTHRRGEGDLLDFTMAEPVRVRHYALASANDAPDRDPRSWVLKGSADGLTWTLLDKRTEESFPGRHQERGFDVTARAGAAYRHFRLEIVANWGSPHTQLSRVRLFAEPPAPDSFTGQLRRAGRPPVPYEGTAERPGPALTTAEQWRAYLTEYSADMLRVAEEGEMDEVAPEQRAASWLGGPGASEERLTALEERLGAPLPPSYRSFLAASDGWGRISLFMWELRGTDSVAPLRDAEPVTWEIIRGEDDDEWEEDRALMDRAVLVSGHGDAQYWLLDPGDVSPDGEWAAYVWASWYPGLSERYASFAALVASERESFEEIQGREGHPVRPEGADELLAQGRDLALRGEVDDALAAFGRAAEKGSGAASYLKVVLSAFLDSRATHHELRGVLHHGHVVEAIGEEQIRAEAVPLLLRCAAQARPGSAGLSARFLADALPGFPGLPVDATGDATVPAWEAWAAAYDAPPLPEPPAFEAALETARGLARGGRTDEAWAVIEEALPAWRPLSPHQVAPVVLLTDPVLRPVLTPRRARAVVCTPRGAQPA